MRATELASLLARNVDGVVRMLLPHGQRKGAEWCVGSTDGEAGGSLKVHMAGEKSGVWSDFSTGDSGDLIGLWMAVRSLSLRDACKEASDYLGVREDRIDPPRRSFAKPSRQGVSSLSVEHLTWFTEARRIPETTVRAYRVASRDGWIMFPYLRDGELIAAKYRKLPKQFRQDAECEPCLFGWHAIPEDARSVLICEGELDAMAWHSVGVPGLSVPMGGGKGAKQGWVQTEFERLALFDVIYLSMDSDGPGQEAERDLVDRLGRERVRIVRLPHKDANECLMQGMEPAEMLACLREARTMDPSELRDVAEFEDAIWAEYSRQETGLCLPWKKTFDVVRLREGETSIWAGVNGHGKSTLVSFIVGDLASGGVKCCVASMEYRAPLWMMRMNRQIAGVSRPTEAFSRHITRKLKGNLLAFNVDGAAKADRILEVFRYARRRYQTQLFVIDNLTKCGFADDDYPGQKRFVEALSDFARESQCHVAIVAHMRKAEDESKPSGKMGVKGSGGITDMVDTVFEVWRNKPKERAVEEAEKAGTPVAEKHQQAADVLLLIHKQRANGNECAIGLWYDQPTTQYLAAKHYWPRSMVDFLAPVAGVS